MQLAYVDADLAAVLDASRKGKVARVVREDDVVGAVLQVHVDLEVERDQVRVTRVSHFQVERVDLVDVKYDQIIGAAVLVNDLAFVIVVDDLAFKVLVLPLVDQSPEFIELTLFSAVDDRASFYGVVHCRKQRRRPKRGYEERRFVERFQMSHVLYIRSVIG